jgi:hypothetical protein
VPPGAISGRIDETLDGLDGLVERLGQDTPADGPEHERERASLEVLALAHDDNVDVGRPVGEAREGVGVTESPTQTFESVVVMTTRLGSVQS